MVANCTYDTTLNEQMQQLNIILDHMFLSLERILFAQNQSPQTLQIHLPKAATEITALFAMSEINIENYYNIVLKQLYISTMQCAMCMLCYPMLRCALK